MYLEEDLDGGRSLQGWGWKEEQKEEEEQEQEREEEEGGAGDARGLQGEAEQVVHELHVLVVAEEHDAVACAGHEVMQRRAKRRWGRGLPLPTQARKSVFAFKPITGKEPIGGNTTTRLFSRHSTLNERG